MDEATITLDSEEIRTIGSGFIVKKIASDGKAFDIGRSTFNDPEWNTLLAGGVILRRLPRQHSTEYRITVQSTEIEVDLRITLKPSKRELDAVQRNLIGIVMGNTIVKSAVVLKNDGFGNLIPDESTRRSRN
jgi:hypothetical protein